MMQSNNTWRFFKLDEFACRCCGAVAMSRMFIAELDDMRKIAGFPFRLSSAYRCPDHNAAVSASGSRTGPHTTGLAVDVLACGRQAYELLAIALEFRIAGIGINQRGPMADRFIHLDRCPPGLSRPRPLIWTY